MTARRTAVALGAALGTAVLSLGLLTPGAARETAPRATLDFGPKGPYVGGSGITLTGRLPTSGVRRIWLERNMGRPGSAWTRIEDLPYRGTTRADGSFRMRIHAPSMVGLSYRVRGGQGGGVTPGVTFNPKTQDVTMQVLDPLDLGAIVVAADTTPSPYRRPDMLAVPLFDGRTLTLQRRVTPTEWRTISTTLAGANGVGIFPPFVETAGEHVYRVRMEDWRKGGDDIGWQASFPTYVDVGSILPRRSAVPVARPEPFRSSPVVTTTAAQRYRWNPVRWGFDWEEGQDLDSPPKNGAPKGRWVQYADGAGRAGKHNGGLRIDSGRLVQDGSGDFGTTRATLTGNANAYGRWETRLRLKTFETRSQDYDVVLELVPERAQDYACGRRNITIARYTGTDRRMTFGVNAMGTRWTRTITGPSLTSSIPAFAVEVARGHISWFVNGRPVGVVRSRAAVSDVPMTLRFGLVGGQRGEYDNSSIYSDWQRGFDIGPGQQVTRGPRLTKQSLSGCVD